MTTQVFPPTTNTLVLATGFTLLVFVTIVSVTTGAALGIYFVLGFIAAFIVSAIGGVVMSPAGIGFAWLALRILRNSRSRLAYASGAFATGALTGAIGGAITSLAFLTPVGGTVDLAALLGTTGLFAFVTGVSALAGWLLAVATSRRRTENHAQDAATAELI